jgi:quinol monooxygenase YgiN
MSLSFGVAGLGAFAAVIFTGLMVSRCVRTPRVDLVALLSASAGLTAALVAQAAGYHGGFGAITFRGIQIGAQMIAPLGLAWALAEMAAKSLGAKFAARLGLAAITVVASVVLTIDPLADKPFSTEWPPASVYYQTPAHVVLLASAAVAALAAVLALATSGARARHDPGWRVIFGVVVPVAVAALTTIGLQVKLPVQPAYAAICLVAAVLTWFAGRRVSELPLDALQAGPGPSWDGRESGYGPMGYNTGYDLYSDTGDFSRGDTDFSGWYRDDTGGFGGEGADSGYGRYRGPDADLGRGGREPSAGNGRGAFETGDILPAVEAPSQPAGEIAEEPEDTSRLYGQIAIYTLLEEQGDEFDRLAHDAVEKVKAHEPDTLVYVMHGVPSAPMQRILYEVYRDEAAFEEHNRQSYVQQFEDDRKPYVLATNVIQLGVRHAMFAPGTGALPTAPASPTGGRRALPAPAAAPLATPRLGLPAGSTPAAAAAPRLPGQGSTPAAAAPARAGLPPVGSASPGAPLSPRRDSPGGSPYPGMPGSAAAQPDVPPSRYPGGSAGNSPYPGSAGRLVYPGGLAEDSSYPGGPGGGSARPGAAPSAYPGGSSRAGRSAETPARPGVPPPSYPGGAAGGSSYSGGAAGGSSYSGGAAGGSPYSGGAAGDSPYSGGAAGDSPYSGGSGGPAGSSPYSGGSGGSGRPRVPPSYSGSSVTGSDRPARSPGSRSRPDSPPWQDPELASGLRPGEDEDEDERHWGDSPWPPTRR